VSAPRASIVIPNWNGAAVLRGCLDSLRAQLFRDMEVIVVDNGSTDGSRALVREEYPEVKLVELPENRGFAAATNAGLKEARAEILVCLNNDTICEREWLGALVTALDERPEFGSVASLMLDGRRPGLVDAAGDAMALVAWNVGKGEPDGPRFRSGREVLSACAGAAAYRRAVFERVGWFDEAYFAWCEDVDLGIRAQLAGFRCWFEPGAVVLHLGSASAAALSEWKLFHTVRNGMVLFFKTMPRRRLLGWGWLMLLWPWMAPLALGYPLGVMARAWMAFLRMLPGVLGSRAEVYRHGTAEVPRVIKLLDSPLDDLRRVAGIAASRAGGAGTAAGRSAAR
jgi:GT2 family glycosyltransferase